MGFMLQYLLYSGRLFIADTFLLQNLVPLYFYLLFLYFRSHQSRCIKCYLLFCKSLYFDILLQCLLERGLCYPTFISVLIYSIVFGDTCFIVFFNVSCSLLIQFFVPISSSNPWYKLQRLTSYIII